MTLCHKTLGKYDILSYNNGVKIERSEIDSLIVYDYIFDVESHADYLYYLETNGWIFTAEDIPEDSSYLTTVFVKNGTAVGVMAHFAQNRTFIAYLNTKISLETFVNGNTISITPKNVPSGSRVVLACYSGSTLTDLQFSKYNNESIVTFTTYQEYDKIKIFVRDSKNIFSPLCDNKDVSIG